MKQIKTIALQTRVRMEEPVPMELIPTSVFVSRGTVDRIVKEVRHFSHLQNLMNDLLNFSKMRAIQNHIIINSNRYQ